MKTVVFLVRHGQTDWNVQKKIQGDLPVPLNAEGRKQAKSIAKLLARHHFDHHFCSPTKRTVETASLIRPKASFEEDEGFIERKFGHLKGLSHEEFRKKIPDVEEQWKKHGIDWRPPGGETIREFNARVITAFESLLKNASKKRSIVITHGIVIKAIVHYLHGGKPENFFHSENFENCAVVRVEKDKQGKHVLFRVRGVDDGNA